MPAEPDPADHSKAPAAGDQPGDRWASLSLDGRQLLAAARLAARDAYCPYSQFHVGAAVLAGGAVFAGCNVENASYGLTVCAERVAIFAAVAAGKRRIEAIAVTCPDAPADAAVGNLMPCGACRQVMAEFGGPQLLVIVDRVGVLRLGELLPNPFSLGS